MADMVHITEVAEFTDTEFDAINAAYERAMSGGPPPLQRVDYDDGTYALVNAEGKVFGLGMSTTIGAGEYLSRIGRHDKLGCWHDRYYPQDWRVVVCRKCGDCRGNQ